MKPQPALVGADRAVHLNAEPAINVEIALIVPPRNAKHDDPLRFDDAMQNFLVPIFGMLFENNRERVDHLLNRLMELRFGRVLRLHLGHQLCNVISHGNASPNAQALDVSVREAKIESKIYDVRHAKSRQGKLAYSNLALFSGFSRWDFSG